MGQVPFDLFRLVGIAGDRAVPLLPPQGIGVLEQRLDLHSERFRLSRLALGHFHDVADQMGEAFVLFHSGQFFGFVAGEAVGDQRSGVIARDDFPHLFIAMLRTDLIDRLLAGVEDHQVGGLAADSPTGVVGVGDRRAPHSSTQLQ